MADYTHTISINFPEEVKKDYKISGPVNRIGVGDTVIQFNTCTRNWDVAQPFTCRYAMSVGTLLLTFLLTPKPKPRVVVLTELLDENGNPVIRPPKRGEYYHLSGSGAYVCAEYDYLSNCYPIYTAEIKQ